MPDSRILGVWSGSRHVSAGDTWYQEFALPGDFTYTPSGDILVLAYTGRVDNPSLYSVTFDIDYGLPHLQQGSGVQGLGFVDQFNGDSLGFESIVPDNGNGYLYAHSTSIAERPSPSASGFDTLVFPLSTSPVKQQNCEVDYQFCWVLARLQMPVTGMPAHTYMRHDGGIGTEPDGTGSTASANWDANGSGSANAYYLSALGTTNETGTQAEGGWTEIGRASVGPSGSWPTYHLAFQLHTNPVTTGDAAIPDTWSLSGSTGWALDGLKFAVAPPYVPVGRQRVRAQLIG